MGVVRNLDPFRIFPGMDDGILMFDQSPLKRLFTAINVETLPVLSCRIKEGTRQFGRQIGILELNMAGLNGKGGAINWNQFFIDPSRPEARDIFCFTSWQCQNRAYAMGGIMHGWQPFPIAGPSCHFLLMRCP